jgi:hypothetical protein
MTHKMKYGKSYYEVYSLPKRIPKSVTINGVKFKVYESNYRLMWILSHMTRKETDRAKAKLFKR